MWQKEDPFTTPVTSPNLPYRWARANRHSRFSGFRITPTRIGIAMIFCAGLFWFHGTLHKVDAAEPPLKPIVDLKNGTVPNVPFQPIESIAYRTPDSVDAFATYKFRNTCNISSLDLHAPFGPLCTDRQSMLTAMASGGRIGFDAPYMPRACDFRWFTSEEICEIFGRFEKVMIIGDSMLRHVTGCFNIFLRKDIGYGAVTDWNFSVQERKECFCNEQFDVKTCSVQGIFKTSDVEAHDPGSISCSNSVNVMMEEIVYFNVPEDEISRLRADLLVSPTSKPIAIIFGHGLWSDLDLPKTVQWLDTLVTLIDSTIGREKWKGLFVTPNAAGKEKTDEWIVSQGNKALMLYEEAVGIEAGKRGLEHLGTWNMSIQARKYDGVHLDLRGNLVKSMMIINWLAML
ncbi:uncharacterized protein EAF01_011125 [Botrytis porri]|uniref:Uncharacterized protein n=1 Tax=Botrytis porri TaxID=87229 RepID=A0A4Z1KY87_9HELO|nr:uncharacterized protein EAF01_011125 [Botrytis porri]KAF7887971.1 hypothetical protein EAF01_011125 [Botrytis porri]TGO89380.1 hypothetical protein BPOR_0112g00110 [Botrytis porri]